MKTYSIPSRECYACDKDSVGVTMHNGAIKAACKRHADPSMRVSHKCIYCDDPVRKGSLRVDNDYAHAKCVRREHAD